MIRCLAIDDEPLALEKLASYIKKVPFFELMGCCQSAIDAKEIMECEMVDAIFCDINMPDLNGLDFVKSLPVPPMVVFTTAYSEYAVEGFKVNAVDYLLKPYGLEDFLRASNKVKARYDQLNTATISAIDEDDVVFLKTEYKVVRLQIRNIRYVEGMSEYLKIHVEGQSRSIIVLLSMKKMEERLAGSSFMRIHRSYIINLKKIQEVTKNRVIMDADTYLPIGDNYKDAFQEYINSKFLGK